MKVSRILMPSEAINKVIDLVMIVENIIVDSDATEECYKTSKSLLRVYLGRLLLVDRFEHIERLLKDAGFEIVIAPDYSCGSIAFTKEVVAFRPYSIDLTTKEVTLVG